MLPNNCVLKAIAPKAITANIPQKKQITLFLIAKITLNILNTLPTKATHIVQ
jgi:hypothetical protein